MSTWIQNPFSGGGSGTVTSVTATDTSIVVTGTAAAPTVATGTLDVIAADHPPAANWSNNSHKITSLANGAAVADAAAFGQILASQAATTAAGYTLVNGTGTIVTWTSPNDGNMHVVALFASLRCTSTETGGQIQAHFTNPDTSTTGSPFQVFAAGLTTGSLTRQGNALFVIAPNTAFTLSQDTALTGGAAVCFAAIWGN